MNPGRTVGWSSVAAMLLAAALGITNVPPPASASGADTGIRGSVALGPIVPGPITAGQPDQAPLSASFSVLAEGRAVARFTSDETGRFQVSLPPGEYTIIPDKRTPIPYPGKQLTRVTVPDDGFAVVTIELDTGMR